MAVPEEIERMIAEQQMIEEQVPHFLDESMFLCELCDRPWPCPPDQQRLLSDYAGEQAALTVYLFTFLEEARVAMPDKTEVEVYDQILGWLPRPRPGDDETPWRAAEALRRGWLR